MNISILTSDMTLTDLKEIERTEKRNTAQPKTLQLPKIYVANQVFQPRLPDETRLASLAHIRELARALADRSKPFDALLITAVGKRFYVVDGHHRLAAYRAVGWSESIPVEVFSGSLAEAEDEALRRNVFTKLPMSTQSKLEKAWGYVQRDKHSKRVIAELTTVAKSTVGNMRKVWKEHQREVSGRPWSVARSKLWTTDNVGQEDWRNAKTQDYADRILKAFGKELSQYPDIFADAIALLNPELPAILSEQWQFRETGNDLDI